MNGTRDERRERARTAMQAAWMELGECPYDSEYERALDIIETFGCECERAGLERAAQYFDEVCLWQGCGCEKKHFKTWRKAYGQAQRELEEARALIAEHLAHDGGEGCKDYDASIYCRTRTELLALARSTGTKERGESQ